MRAAARTSGLQVVTYVFEVIADGKYSEIRGLEQRIMDHYSSNGIKLENKIRGISLSNINYGSYLDDSADLFKKILKLL